MTLESFRTDDLVRIAAAGGGFRLDAGNRLTNDLVRIAAAASNKNAKLVLVGCTSRSIDDMVRIAAAGKGNVFFE